MIKKKQNEKFMRFVVDNTNLTMKFDFEFLVFLILKHIFFRFSLFFDF